MPDTINLSQLYNDVKYGDDGLLSLAQSHEWCGLFI